MSMRNFFHYDIIILDEAQDINPLYFQLIHKIIKDNNDNNIQIVILGDEKQSIFDFNKADQRFITFADIIFNFNDKEWKKCKLTQSFRITYEMSEFLNKCVLNIDTIFSSKISNIKPRYIICDTFGGKIGTSDRTFEEVKYYLDTLKYSPDDIFIIAPSVKNILSPVRQLENCIKKYYKDDVQVYVPTGDDSKLDSEILKGKLVFSTFHQTKGLERKVVIVFNFDNSYFIYFKKDTNPNICPNELYVATTRALEHLTIFHHYENDFLPFIHKENIKNFCYFENMSLKIKSENKGKICDTATTELIKHLPQEILDKCYDFLEINNIRNKKTIIDIPIKIKEKHNNIEYSEGVSEITGLAIPSYYELKLKGKMDIYDRLINTSTSNSGCLIQLDEDDIEKPDIGLININLKQLLPSQLLYIANLWISKNSGFIFKINQIKSYDWLSKENLELCINRMNELYISENASFEKKCEINKINDDNKELRNRKIIGIFDCVDNERIFEFKCVQQLEKEHFLQLAVYMYMNKKTNIIKCKKQNDKKNYCIIRDLTNKLNEIQKINKFMLKDKTACEEKITKYKTNCKTKIQLLENLKIITKKYDDNQVQNDDIKNKIKYYYTQPHNTETIEYKYYLYNILTDEMYEIKCDMNKLIEMVDILITNKYYNKHTITDANFLINIDIIKNKA
jgi:hypothetical protein